MYFIDDIEAKSLKPIGILRKGLVNEITIQVPVGVSTRRFTDERERE